MTTPKPLGTSLHLTCAAPVPGPPNTALAMVLRRWRARLPRELAVLFAVCLGIATLLLALSGGRFHIKLTYALCIGLSCTAINDLSWIAQAWGYDRLRALRGLPISAGPYGAGWAGTLPSAALCLLLGPPLGQAMADRVFGFHSPSLLDLDNPNTRVTLVICLLATVVLMLVLSASERLATARAQAEAAQRQAAENQLRLLQSQLEPHMLFNTLANLRVLIGLEPVRAQAMLDHLINFLRATLNASRSAAHPLATEFERLADYLALMGVRMGLRLRVELDLPAALRELPVPPLLLQPLVENAIKHGLEPHVEGGVIRVSARCEGRTLVLAVRDTGSGLPSAMAAASGTQFGLVQVRERLATLHGDAATLTLEAAADGGGGTLATVRLPMLGPLPADVTANANANANAKVKKASAQ